MKEIKVFIHSHRIADVISAIRTASCPVVYINEVYINDVLTAASISRERAIN